MKKNSFTPIENIIAIAKRGGMFILVDDEKRENEGDLIISTTDSSAKNINFMAKYGRGLICLALDSVQAKRLNLSLMSPINQSRNKTAFTISIEAKKGITTGISAKIMEFYLSSETIKRSKFKFLKVKDRINLELPLKYGQKISGHICQGHIDTVGKILNIKIIDKSYLFEFEIVKKERINLIEKASVCVNGISLTISKLTKKGFQLWVIPHTFKLTNLSSLKKSSLVNIEIDILSKYVRNYFNEKK